MNSLIKKVAISLIAICSIFILSGCSDDDSIESLEGKLNITFVNKPYGLEIYSMENMNVPLYGYNETFYFHYTYDLNMGNYILRVNYQKDFAFQIRPGKTTTITFDENDKGSVSYK